MVIAPYLSAGNLLRQLRAVWTFRRATRWRHFIPWIFTSSWRSLPLAAGAVGMGCIGHGYHAVWEVTEACNLRCRHCHAKSDEGGADELDTQEGCDFIDQLSRLKRFQMLACTGGEPLVRPDLDRLLAHMRKRGLVSVIATNGTLLDSGRARELKRLGVKGVAVGFDSTDPAVHNHIRRHPDAFQKALAGIEACKRAGLALQINFTAMRENLATFETVVRFCHEVKADIMLCYQLIPMGRGLDIRASALSAADNQQLVRKLRELQKDTITIVEPVAAPQYWAHLLGRDHPEPKPAVSGRVFHGCAAGWGLIYLKPNGDVWPCPFVPVSGGNIRSRSLRDIWKHSPVMSGLADRSRLQGKCGACDNRSICGGCRGKAFAASGDIWAEDPACYLHPAGPPR